MRGSIFTASCPHMPEDDWAAGADVWGPNDPEVKKDWSAAVIGDLNDAERRVMRSWALSEPVEPKRLAAVSKRLAECCICRAERRRDDIVDRIRSRPNRTELLQHLHDDEISVLTADIVDRALDVMTPEEAQMLAGVPLEDLEPASWAIAKAMYEPARDVIRVGGATDPESLGHELVHRAAEKIREELLAEALKIDEQSARTSPLAESALQKAERIASSDKVITLRSYARIHFELIRNIPHAERPEVLCALAAWANRHPGSKAATWRFASEYWAHRAVGEPDVKRGILRRALESGVRLPREDVCELPRF